MYIEVYSIDVPSKAVEGQELSLSTFLHNHSSYTCSVRASVQVFKGSEVVSDFWLMPYEGGNLSPGGFKEFSGTITMPDGKAKVRVWSWYYASDGKWHSDEHEDVDIALMSMEEALEIVKVSTGVR